MKSNLFFFLSAVMFAFSSHTAFASRTFIQVKDTQFVQAGKPYRFLSANFWSAMNLAHRPGGEKKLQAELSQLKKNGVRHLRVLALSEGSDTSPWQIVPTTQPDFGKWNESLLKALDRVMVEASQHDMTVTLVLGNFWPWSGGFGQYVRQFTGEAIPYPPPADGGDWTVYQNYVGRFYSTPKAVKAYLDSIKKIVLRKNTLSGVQYKDDPTLFSWQLANEPRGNLDRPGFLKWIEASTKLIRSLDSNHLISLGSEGNTPYGLSIGNHFEEDHSIAGIDYTTAHVWAENWGWYDPKNPGKTWTQTLNHMRTYIRQHSESAKKLNRPLVIEEFGLARDQRSHDPKSKTSKRDQYYQAVFNEVLQSIQTGGPIQGVGFWAWSGQERPKKPYGGIWLPGDPLLGDPPHEHQGWYGVYATDRSTLKVFKDFAKKLSR